METDFARFSCAPWERLVFGLFYIYFFGGKGVVKKTVLVFVKIGHAKVERLKMLSLAPSSSQNFCKFAKKFLYLN